MDRKALSKHPDRLGRVFHIMVKPVGSLCNLECTYCYYLHKDELLGDRSSEPISAEVLEDFVRQYITGQDVNLVVFTWHGGEPALAGLDFYRKAVQLQKKHAGGKHIANRFQTNGLLLDREWCQFFKENDFLVGLSIDGPQHVHDQFRLSKGGSPSFEQVCAAARLLREHGVAFNTMTVVHAVSARQPVEIYRFLTEELGSRQLQWLPCVETKDYRTVAPAQWDHAAMPVLGTPAVKPGHAESMVTDWSVDPDDWGEFLCQTFDLWLKRDVGKVVVNWFEPLVAQWAGLPAQSCFFAEVCGRSLALEWDGSLYPCDHFVYPEYKLGSLPDENRPLAHMAYSARQREFGFNKRNALTDYCKRCSYLFACHGDCPKHRLLKSPDGQPGLSYLCSGLKRFFAYVDPHVRQMMASLQGSHAADA